MQAKNSPFSLKTMLNSYTNGEEHLQVTAKISRHMSKCSGWGKVLNSSVQEAFPIQHFMRKGTKTSLLPFKMLSF